MGVYGWGRGCKVLEENGLVSAWNCEGLWILMCFLLSRSSKSLVILSWGPGRKRILSKWISFEQDAAI